MEKFRRAANLCCASARANSGQWARGAPRLYGEESVRSVPDGLNISIQKQGAA